MATFILTYTFPVLHQALGAAKTFWVPAAICPRPFARPKGKTLEDSEHLVPLGHHAAGASVLL